MKGEHFVKVVEEVLDSIPREFRSRIRNVAVLVEDMPPNQPLPQSGEQRRLLLGLFRSDEEVLDSIPREFRSRIRNVAVLVEDMPPNQPLPQSGEQRRLLLGLFQGVPTTKKSIFHLPTGPDYIVLYQKEY